MYDPLGEPPAEPDLPVIEYYDRQSGLFTYLLKVPSRVHVQAGQAFRNPDTGQMEGPVLRTIVDREPRTGGKILESWRGFDAEDRLYIPDLPNFVMAVAATPLPPHAMVVVGTHGRDFLEYALRRRPPAATKSRDLAQMAGQHHEVLNALEDRSPDLKLKPAEGSWDSTARAWRFRDGRLRIDLLLDSRTRPYFLSQAGAPIVFLDEKPLESVRFETGTSQLEIETDSLKPGLHVVTVNWPSHHGPVAVGVLPIFKEGHGGDRGTE